MIVLRRDKTLVVILEDGSHCSKVFTTDQKAKDMKEHLENELPSIEHLVSRDRDRYPKLYKFHLTQPRYQDKRRVEKVIRDYNSDDYLIPKKKDLKEEIQTELKIPVPGGNRAVYWVRESHIFKAKWINLFESREALEQHIAKFKSTINKS